MLIVVISCQKELKLEKENFNLKQGFTKISKKLTVNDTVGVFINLSFFRHDARSDYLSIFKSKDSLFVSVSRSFGFKILDENGNEVENRYVGIEDIGKLEDGASKELISFRKGELFLKFDKLVQENKNVFEATKSFEIPHLIFQNQSDTLQFNFLSKKDWKNFKYDYCQLMYNFSSYNQHYKEWGDTYFKDSIY